MNSQDKGALLFGTLLVAAICGIIFVFAYAHVSEGRRSAWRNDDEPILPRIPETAREAAERPGAGWVADGRAVGFDHFIGAYTNAAGWYCAAKGQREQHARNVQLGIERCEVCAGKAK